ncbi:ankyrin repeat domain-containing protein [Massilia sp. Dwa41.01b]|uniref:ankyrin repeat domain-containing protein n=1 Tax=unclassified Massilia TaxID=2609279 RepID=UPI0015FECC4D|nr:MULTISPECIES: ankyrin repeat domain-containing protein [unclassified Massilia]QNA89047.1 ankyrin repeat domain-containing protein [Massilia sp. Dwa41.01b]QNA99935.1 ankyrin repeat domain-containing protein [Massilia sp. Se16.2.3]
MDPRRRIVLLRLLQGSLLVLGARAGLLQAAPAAPTAEQLTTFFRAVQLDDARTVQAMIGKVVNANQRNPLGGEPGLVLALREDAMRVFQVFLDHPGTDLETRAANGNTALMMAAFKRQRAAVDALLARGAKVNGAGWTALHYAAAAGDDGIVELLLARGAKIDAVSSLKSGAYTPLMMAAREGQDGTALLLLKKGANAGLKNSEGLSAVQIAERAGKSRVAEAIARALR